jgi:hypothetical protein
MEDFMGTVRATLVEFLLIAAVIVLVEGLGLLIPSIKAKNTEVVNVPAGVILLGAAIALARHWVIKKKQRKLRRTSTVSGQTAQLLVSSEGCLSRCKSPMPMK